MISDFGLRIADSPPSFLDPSNPGFAMKTGSQSKIQNPHWQLGFQSEIRNPRSEIKVGCKVNQEELKQRTRQFALRIIRLVESLPQGRTAEVIARQLLRSGTSVGANYRAACRAKSTRDFISKMGIVEEEADETLYWMEVLSEADIVESEKLALLMKEADELLSIVVASIKTARKRSKKS